MKIDKPITIEIFRRFFTLLFITSFVWLFFYTPSDIYMIEVKDYSLEYKNEIKKGLIEPSSFSFEDYIASKMKGPYNLSNKRKKNIVEVKGESRDFLNEILSVNRSENFNENIVKSRSTNTAWSTNSYYFTKEQLPKNLLSKNLLKDAHYLLTKSNNAEKHYFKLYEVKRNFVLSHAPLAIKHPFRNYSYIMILLSLIIYISLPKVKLPKDSAYFARLNSIYLVDGLSVFLWLFAWVLFFFSKSDDSAPIFVSYFLLAFFGIFALIISFNATKYASNWFLFTNNTFEWSGLKGIQKVSLNEIVSVKPYTKQLPKWVAPLIILFGRGDVGPTGWGLIAGSSTPEIGMEMKTRNGNKIRIMANYLITNALFTKRFQALEKKLNVDTNGCYD